MAERQESAISEPSIKHVQEEVPIEMIEGQGEVEDGELPPAEQIVESIPES